MATKGNTSLRASQSQHRSDGSGVPRLFSGTVVNGQQGKRISSTASIVRKASVGSHLFGSQEVTRSSGFQQQEYERERQLLQAFKARTDKETGSSFESNRGSSFQPPTLRVPSKASVFSTGFKHSFKASEDRREYEDRRKENEMKLLAALSEKDSHGEDREGSFEKARPSGTIRRYSEVLKENRMTLKFSDVLAGDAKSSHSSGSFRTVEAPGWSKSQDFLGSKVQAKTSQTRHIPLSHVQSSSRIRKQEEQALQEMDGNRQLRYLVELTHFKEGEVLALERIYKTLTETEENVKANMTYLQFREVLEKHFGISGEAMIDQICHYFDSTNLGYITCTQWVRKLSTFLRGTFEEHTKYCFEIYDLKREGAIGKMEILTLLHECLIQVPGVEEDVTDITNIREVAENLLKKFDSEKAGSISFTEFRNGVRRDPLCLQCLGQCLPDPKEEKTFMALIADSYNSFRTNYSLPRMPGYDYERDRFNPEAFSTYGMMRALRKSKTAIHVVKNLFSPATYTTLSSTHAKHQTNKMLRGEHHPFHPHNHHEMQHRSPSYFQPYYGR